VHELLTRQLIAELEPAVACLKRHATRPVILQSCPGVVVHVGRSRRARSSRGGGSWVESRARGRGPRRPRDVLSKRRAGPTRGGGSG
jgi:hypothetical protein